MLSRSSSKGIHAPTWAILGLAFAVCLLPCASTSALALEALGIPSEYGALFSEFVSDEDLAMLEELGVSIDTPAETDPAAPDPLLSGDEAAHPVSNPLGLPDDNIVAMISPVTYAAQYGWPGTDLVTIDLANVRPEVQAAIDDYVYCWILYIDTLDAYIEDRLLDAARGHAELLLKAEEAEAAFEAIDEDDLNPDEELYYYAALYGVLAYEYKAFFNGEMVSTGVGDELKTTVDAYVNYYDVMLRAMSNPYDMGSLMAMTDLMDDMSAIEAFYEIDHTTLNWDESNYYWNGMHYALWLASVAEVISE